MRIPDKILKFRKLNQTQITAIVIAVICVLVFGLFVFLPVGNKDEIKNVIIEKGTGLSEIASILKENNIIRDRYVFMLYTTALGAGKDLKAGKYKFTGRFHMTDIVFKLNVGLSEPEDIIAFIPEGYNIWEIDERLSALGFTKKGQFAKANLDQEGFLFPDTYKIDSDNALYVDSTGKLSENSAINSIKQAAVIQNISDKMRANFNKQIDPLLKDLTFDKRKEVLILASMLEKEVRTENDMRLVAGIMYKRLKKGMPLQIDATVSYGACLRNFVATDYKIDCDVTQIGVGKEIRIDSEYNTYTRKTLPIGPISNPGVRSIKAMLNPLDSPYLYYLTTRDGQMIYSKTGWEHEANRTKYLKSQ
ncbi:MAG: Aminodeoxychorismate lyase [Candidatus Yanofskybacteria bacterium GW2011_GWF1_44_227]|uniref:Endolytic murein transglycosylase n=1 Tax=Candidatus Yanofskybacteria bacterium GW2011_GWE2_40_11 TaxID=1619033 RepID=A0A0G0TQY8_9BACT|nr:MAG: Aminodeoxychorismate lyase [Candidatus Yanofskybacteria bacterium GW2011_GWE1_40_10]KKR40252.1 MAG: Aminodeoxychorismate lyase [Candidatus Yanofskybacteria bacterium GW2011_GWE2_40_11]KKT15328.1 MAG: Aminodeoxychorismate lyase [Candidatus Yanofskybacteria bacterium GW2011_GWF2_43_596]KKT52972.1 MAG: Aminodeoxychorismate lyase [Candidatus Yanofskybacteria bacterium GW2011_GWF1_44_227]OGN36125.1 MAG: hypothetical protein A2241_00025 [Candidatus Yanofskybacteria bacterium RIFOXYA2_FULL_45_